MKECKTCRHYHFCYNMKISYLGYYNFFDEDNPWRDECVRDNFSKYQEDKAKVEKNKTPSWIDRLINKIFNKKGLKLK